MCHCCLCEILITYETRMTLEMWARTIVVEGHCKIKVLSI